MKSLMARLNSSNNVRSCLPALEILFKEWSITSVKLLGEKIDREKGKTTPKGPAKEQSFDIYEAMMCPSSCNIAVIQDMLFSWVSHLAGIQAIIENMAEAKKIHIVDLEIRSGKHWTILMQALVSRPNSPVEHLKITAIDGPTSEKIIRNTGKRLISFAETMNLPFSFKMVIVSDMMELKEELFELDAEEKVAVFSEFILTSLITPAERLDSVMKVIRHLNPCIMVVAEVEASHNSPVFVNRFIETLFFVSAYFDCFDACFERDNPNRKMAQYMFFGEGVRKVLASEGEERNIRNVKIDVWRAFFARFRMEETELSISSLYQADLVVKKFESWSSCTVDVDGKSLIIWWKGTPIHCLSVWKFV